MSHGEIIKSIEEYNSSGSVEVDDGGGATKPEPLLG